MRRRCITVLILLLFIMTCSGCGYKVDNLNINKRATDSNNISEETKNPTNPAISTGNPIGDSNKYLRGIEADGFNIIEEQSYWIKLDNWGKVRFVSGYYKETGLPKLDFYLVDSEDNIVYHFPEYYGNMWVFYEVKAISFKDVNRDGLTDIIVVADYILGHGENAATPFPIASIYFRNEVNFINFTDLDKEINEAKQNDTIDMVLKFVSGKDIKLYK